VIVEEAAEILEPSLVATLTANTRHLILIGDHQQLRPQVNTYELRKKYHFDVSMMERLIKNKFPYKSLQKQSRMRPEFSELLKDIYPYLEDNTSVVTNNQKLECMVKSMFFWNHQHIETGVADQGISRSKTNPKEAEMAVYLAMYFLLNGVKKSEITILSAYLGQARVIRQQLRELKSKLDLLCDTEETITVQTIDMYQGDENKYVIVSLVRSGTDSIGFLNTLNRRCVSQSRAKCGLYYVGNANTLRQVRNSVWDGLITKMEDQGCCSSTIDLCCPRHPDKSRISVRDADSIKKIVENPRLLCKMMCALKMPCGIHICGKCCVPIHDELHDLCRAKVDIILSKCGHKMQKLCHQAENDVRCAEPCQKMNNCKLHTCQNTCGIVHTHDTCGTMVDYKFPGCEHPSPKKKKCSEQISWRCEYPQFVTLPCQHDTKKGCSEDIASIVCQFRPCLKDRKCGHPCINKCGEDCNNGNCTLCEEAHKVKMKKVQHRARQKAKKLIERMKTTDVFTKHEVINGGSSSAEYMSIQDQVLKYIQPMHNFSPYITKIEKITNLILEQKFEECKATAFGDDVQRKFHGTGPEGIEGIPKTGFRMPDKAGMYGQGIYFATDSSKSAQAIYTKGSNKLLLCDVLLGKSKQVNRADPLLTLDKIRRSGFDSIFAPRGTKSSGGVENDEFVVFDAHQALPKYIISYDQGNIRHASQTLSQTVGPRYQKKTIKLGRSIDLNDAFENVARTAESHFFRMIQHHPGRLSNIKIGQVDVVINKDLEDTFEKKKLEFKRSNISCKEVLAYHGTDANNIDSILKTNLQMSYAKRQAFGPGNYFSEFPDVSQGYGSGLLLFRIIPGTETTYNSGDRSRQSTCTKVQDTQGQGGYGQMLIIKDSAQFIPLCVIHVG